MQWFSEGASLPEPLHQAPADRIITATRTADTLPVGYQNQKKMT